MALAHITDHAARVVARILSQYQKLTSDFVPLLEGIAGLAQETENVFWDMYTQLNLSVATGAWLDQLGALVGEAREGITDDATYRRFIEARVMANRSKGDIEQLIAVAKKVMNNTGTVVVADRFPAGVEVTIGGVALTTLRVRVQRMLQRTRAAAIGLMVLSQSDANNNLMFYWDDTTSPTPGAPGLGWADSVTPANPGGLLGNAERA